MNGFNHTITIHQFGEVFLFSVSIIAISVRKAKKQVFLRDLMWQNDGMLLYFLLLFEHHKFDEKVVHSINSVGVVYVVVVANDGHIAATDQIKFQSV